MAHLDSNSNENNGNVVFSGQILNVDDNGNMVPLDGAKQDQKFDLGKILRPYKAYWKEILAATVLGGLLAYGVSHTRPKMYSAQSVGTVVTSKTDNLVLANTGDQLAKSRAKTYVDLAKTNTIAEGVIRELNLTNVTPSQVTSRITVNNPTDTTNISISATGSTPEAAKDLADAWVKMLGEQVSQVQNMQPAGAATSSTGSTNDNDNVVSFIPTTSAVLPKSPSSPNRLRYGLAGSILGLGSGIGYAWYRGQNDRRVRSRQDIEDNFSTPILGMIPLEEHPKLIDISGSNSEHGSENYRMVESFRELRTNIRYSGIDDSLRSIVVTSPTPGDGKSTIASNLGIALAASGEKVVMIDCDLRRPTMAKVFGINADIGLSEVVTGQVQLQDALVKYDAEGEIFILPSGKIPPNPAELLESKKLANIIQGFTDEGAFVILDSPPLLSVNDSAALSRTTDGAVVVITANKTEIDEIQHTLDSLKKVDGKCLGLVLNRVPTTGSDARYYGKYSSSNYYYYYGNSSQHKAQQGSKLSQKFGSSLNKKKVAKTVDTSTRTLDTSASTDDMPTQQIENVETRTISTDSSEEKE
ncbi:MAG: polysaccharide biosynthesis tyrosine autokinase [Micrococcaceae bacterium]